MRVKREVGQSNWSLEESPFHVQSKVEGSKPRERREADLERIFGFIEEESQIQIERSKGSQAFHRLPDLLEEREIFYG